MEGLRVVDRRGDSGRLQLRHEGGSLGAVAGEDRVLRPGASIAFGNLRRCDDTGEEFVVVGGDLLAEFDLLGEDLELGKEDRGLEGVQPAVDPDPDVLVLVAPLAVDPDVSAGPRRGGRRS